MKTNTRRFAYSIGAMALAVTLGCASTAKQEGTGEYVDDTVITTKVKSAILNEPTLKVTEIKVETFPFTLYGTIPGKVLSVSDDAAPIENFGQGDRKSVV